MLVSLFKRLVIGICVFTMLWSVGSAWAADKKTKLNICYLEWGKFGGEKLPAKGIHPDIATRVFHNAGYDVKIVITEWTVCIKRTRLMKFDLVAAAWEGDTFDPDFEYLENTTVDSINFITLKSSPLSSGEFADLKGKRIGVLRDAGGMERFYNNQQLFKVIRVPNEEKMLRMLMARRIEALVSDPAQFIEVANKLTPPLGKKLRVLRPAIQTNFASPMISKRHPYKAKIKADYAASYSKLVKSGLYDEIAKTHGIRATHRPIK